MQTDTNIEGSFKEICIYKKSTKKNTHTNENNKVRRRVIGKNDEFTKIWMRSAPQLAMVILLAASHSMIGEILYVEW